ncbi:MAG: LPS-assembly protein LptD [Nitrospirae bacterium]|nr:LPS-assembly protein LptD [Nitrospirota bacterium]
MRNWKQDIGKIVCASVKKAQLPVYIFFLSFLMSYSSVALAATPATITADFMEHFKDEDKYVATGNVILKNDKTVVHADRAVLFEKAAHVEAEGHVIYEDETTLINAERAELNLDTRTGKMYNALILLKDQKSLEKKRTKIDFWINSDKVEKINDTHYYASTATFTTCETIAETEGRYQAPLENKAFAPDNPDWCFKGSNVDILIGDRIAGKDMVYRVKGQPLIYFPYFRMPDTDRQTGLIYPLLGHSNTKGYEFSPEFFWAIDENKDATLSLDYFSKRGVGEGLEYRYLDIDDKGKWYAYHLGDRQEKKDYFVFKGMHDQKFGDVKVWADINYVNQWDYYNQFAPNRDSRIERYTQSSAEISVPFSNSRAYLLGQHWVDLQTPPALQTPPLPSQPVPQRLPEVGYVINPTNIGPLLFSMNTSLADFMRTGDVNGQRLNINPRLWYSFGDAVQVFQSLSGRETAYNLANTENTYSSNPHRETFQYDAYALTRFVKQYESGTHVIEPSLSYTLSPGYSHPLPLFDSVDINNNYYYTQPLGTYALISRTSLAQFSVLNQLSFRDFSVSARLIQPYAFNTVAAPGHAFQPTSLALWVTSGPVSVSLNEVEDLNTMKEQSSTATVSWKLAEGTTMSVSRYYALTVPVTEQYSAGFATALSKAWTVFGNMWYDQNQGGFRDFALHTVYTAQCWGLDLLFQRKPPDTIHPSEYSLSFMVQLKGFGGLKLYEYSSQFQQKQ